MRSAEAMLALILGVARADERIRAVYMNGSRANPNAPRDRYQDFDIVYVVRDIAPFRRPGPWLDVFGPRVMMQEPDRMDALRGGPEAPEDVAVYLMLFEDGNRMDLGVETVAHMLRGYADDTMTLPLLDKDGVLPPMDPPSDRGYWTSPPAQGAFIACCNNFWWCLQNVAKGILRGEMPYARGMFEQVIRPELDEMVAWGIGLAHGFSVNAGKFGKWFARLLPADQWALYERTFAGGEDAALWDAVDAACALFRQMGHALGQALSLPYPREDDSRMTAYLQALRVRPEHDNG